MDGLANKRKWGRILVYVICAMLTAAAFFANKLVLYQFHMMPSDYQFVLETGQPPAKVSSAVWFAYGDDRELQFWTDDHVSGNEDGQAGAVGNLDILMYAKTAEGITAVDLESSQPIREDFTGYFVAVAGERQDDIDGDGKAETVYDSARADFGPHAYAAVPRGFHSDEIPFEVCFEERKKIQVFFRGKAVTASDFQRKDFKTDDSGYIKNLPVKYIRSGLTVSYEPKEGTVYRMYYALEDYAYFSPHFWKAQIPLLLILALSAAGIVLVHLIRKSRLQKSPEYRIYSREKAGIYAANPLMLKTESHFLLIRWLFLMAGFFLWTYAGKIVEQGQVLNQIAVPVFSCPFNLDQTLESSCYYLTHLPELFTTRSFSYIAAYMGTLFLFLILFGRILCGFMCPLGFVQDLMDKLRTFLHIRPIIVTDRMNQILQPLKWTWILLFLCFTFTGGNFCDICPNKIFSPALGGYWIDLVLGGILTIPLLVGSFFIKRFWCIMCPMGYLLGIFYKLNIFKLKKDCTACTECGACYAACPMRLKNIYTERGKENIQTVVDMSFDGMVYALADRYIKPCTCPVFADNSQRIFRIRQMVKEYQVQGIVCHILRGCLVYDYEYPILEEELEQMGVPVIRIESDYNEEDVEQLRIRMEAFIEMIKMKEYHKQKRR